MSNIAFKFWQVILFCPNYRGIADEPTIKTQSSNLNFILFFSVVVALTCAVINTLVNIKATGPCLASVAACVILGLLICNQRKLLSSSAAIDLLILTSLVLISAESYLYGGLDNRLILWLLVVSFFFHVPIQN